MLSDEKRKALKGLKIRRKPALSLEEGASEAATAAPDQTIAEQEVQRAELTLQAVRAEAAIARRAKET